MNSPQAGVGIDDDTRRQIALEEQLKQFAGPLVQRNELIAAVVFTATLGSLILWAVHDMAVSPTYGALFACCALAYLLVILGLIAWIRKLMRTRIQSKLSSKVNSINAKSDELQDKLEENFFTNLVKINFKYIDKYYLQTQLQADKSFVLCVYAASLSLLLVGIGIVLLFIGVDRPEPGYVATSAGILGEFIAAVFFYLYNKTITKMGDYHQKLVLTQNVSLALRISENLPEQHKVAAQIQLIASLSKDINHFLVSGQGPAQT